MRNLLQVWTSNIQAVKQKGVTHILEGYLEDDFFDELLMLSPFSKQTNDEYLLKRVRVVEYGWQFGFSAFNRLKIARALGAIRVAFFLVFGFVRIAKNSHIAVVRATDPYLVGLIGLFYARILRTPFVVSIHSDYDKGYALAGRKAAATIFGSRLLAKKLEHFIFKQADLILPIREHIKKTILAQYRLDPQKVLIFPHGISLQDFDNTPYLNMADKLGLKNNKIISFSGRLSNENYIDDVVEIAQKLRTQRQDFVFVIAGGGIEMNRIKAKIIQEQMSEYFHLLGFVSQQDVINLRRQSDVSLCLMAGFSLIEACFAARPVIAYDVEWHYELVHNDETGFLVQEHDIAHACDRLNFLLDNKACADLMGQNARSLAISRHEINKTIAIKQGIYKKLLGENLA